MFSMQSMRQVPDTTTEELLEEAFSVRSMPRCYKAEKLRICLVVRQLLASKDMCTKVELSTALKAIIRKWLLKTQQAENT
jgi:hypothetical protein